ncbi:MAG: redoxin family protein [Gammaproteobacteria bacterium]|jgi:peroxiredoxin|tara:strand:- start:3493 stop:4092 length:600 start_codon:yes stop_codon:yes gene_type:complete
MKIKILSLLLLSLLATTSVNNGDTAPSFTLLNQDNKTVSLDEFKGKKIILEWTNHDCPFVKRHYDTTNMQTIQKDMTDNEIVWLSIISSAEGKQGHVSKEQAKELTLKRNAHPTHVLLDTKGNVGRMFSAKTTPHMFVIDELGKVRYQGAIDNLGNTGALFSTDLSKAKNYVKNAVSQLMSGEEVKDKKTRPYGCSIKY